MVDFDAPAAVSDLLVIDPDLGLPRPHLYASQYVYCSMDHKSYIGDYLVSVSIVQDQMYGSNGYMLLGPFFYYLLIDPDFGLLRCNGAYRALPQAPLLSVREVLSISVLYRPVPCPLGSCRASYLRPVTPGPELPRIEKGDSG